MDFIFLEKDLEFIFLTSDLSLKTRLLVDLNAIVGSFYSGLLPCTWVTQRYDNNTLLSANHPQHLARSATLQLSLQSP